MAPRVAYVIGTIHISKHGRRCSCRCNLGGGRDIFFLLLLLLLRCSFYVDSEVVTPQRGAGGGISKLFSFMLIFISL